MERKGVKKGVTERERERLRWSEELDREGKRDRRGSCKEKEVKGSARKRKTW